MRISIEQWPLSKLVALEDKINPKPQFQRGEVWGDSRKQLLVDSMLRGFDMPKIYLSKNTSELLFVYDVADGQQRLRAIWEFFRDGYPLGAESSGINGTDFRDLHFSGLPKRIRQKLNSYKATIAILTGATTDELRTLFARLQMGIVLTPAELRNAISSAIGAVINTTAETHSFFTDSKIPKKRYKRQDFLAHALTVAYYGNKVDLKAPQLSALYRDMLVSYDKKLVEKTHDVLDCMAQVNKSADRRIFNKWGFVDLFWYLFQRHGQLASLDVQAFAEAFVDFENQRIRYNNKPETLVRIKSKAHIYAYIQAFNISGAVKGRVGIRNSAFARVFKSIL